MKNAFIILCLGFLLTGTGLAQDEKTQLTNLYQSSQDPLEAQVLTDLVTLNLSPEWWGLLLDPADSDARTQLRILLSGTIDLADKINLGDLRELNDITGRNGDSPEVKAMISGWKGKISLTINMEFVPDSVTKKYSLETLNDITHPFSYKANPRNGMMNFTATLSPAATKLSGTVSPDGGTYKIIFPVTREWRQHTLEKYFEAGR